MEEKEPSKLSYEQLENLAIQSQQRLLIAENKLKNIDFASIRLSWLFRVLEHKDSFSHEFMAKCATEIEEMLTLDEEPSDNNIEKE